MHDHKSRVCHVCLYVVCFHIVRRVSDRVPDILSADPLWQYQCHTGNKKMKTVFMSQQVEELQLMYYIAAYKLLVFLGFHLNYVLLHTSECMSLRYDSQRSIS